MNKNNKYSKLDNQEANQKDKLRGDYINLKNYKKNELNKNTGFFNWKFLTFLFATLSFSLLESYFHTLVKFNNNSIFNSDTSLDPDHGGEARFFSFIFSEFSLGNASNPHWSSRLFSFIFLAFLAEKSCAWLFSVFNRGMTKISENSVYFENEKVKQSKLKILSEKITPLFVLIVSSVQLIFEAWFFWHSILKKGLKKGGEIGYLSEHIGSSVILLLLYYSIFHLLPKLLNSNFAFKNENYEPLVKENKVLPELKVSLYEIFPTAFSPLYFLFYNFSPYQLNLSKNKKVNFTPLRVNSFLYAAYLVSFFKKIEIFLKACRSFQISYFSRKDNDIETGRHTQAAEGVSFEN